MAAGSDSDVGRTSARQFAVLDVPRHPEKYVALEARTDSKGQVWIALQNRAPVALRAIQLRVVVLDAQGRTLRGPASVTSGSRALESNQVIELATGLGPVTTQAELKLVRWQIDGASVAQ
jgi:hypothetical protein